jgi:phosphonate transport system substrate-binding protein
MHAQGLKRVFLTAVVGSFLSGFLVSSNVFANESVATPTSGGTTTGSGSQAGAQPKEITIGFIPSVERESLKPAALVLVKKLQDELGVPVNGYIPKSYSSLAKAMKEKKVDFAFMTAGAYVSAEKDLKLQVLLKRIWSEPFYYSIIIVRKDSGIKKLDELKGKRFAFVDPKSGSGYLYPQLMFRKKGWTDKTFKEVKFSGSHSASVKMLENKEIDAIAVFADDKEGLNSAWTKFGKEENASSVKILWESEPIPNDPFCVRQEFYDQYPKIVHNLMFALIDAVESMKENKKMTDVLGAKGFMPATSRQYDPVRELVKELGPIVD